MTNDKYLQKQGSTDDELKENCYNAPHSGNKNENIRNHHDRPSRSRKEPIRYGDHVSHDILGQDYCFNVSVLNYCYNVNIATKSFSEAMKSDNKLQWKLAMDR